MKNMKIILQVSSKPLICFSGLNNFTIHSREKEDDKLLNKNVRGGVMGQKYGEPSSSSAQHLTISVDHSTSVSSSNKDLSSQLNKSDKYLKQMPVMS